MNSKPTMVTRISNVFGLCPYTENYQKFTPLLVKFGEFRLQLRLKPLGFTEQRSGAELRTKTTVRSEGAK